MLFNENMTYFKGLVTKINTKQTKQVAVIDANKGNVCLNIFSSVFILSER